MCLVSLFYKSLWYVVSGRILFSFDQLQNWPDSSFSLSYFFSLLVFPTIFTTFHPLSFSRSHLPASLCLKPHIHSLSVSREIPVDQRKWSHFLVVPRRTFHHTHSMCWTQIFTSSPSTLVYPTVFYHHSYSFRIIRIRNK